MPELRRDPVIGRWVIVNEKRGIEPISHIKTTVIPQENCPFCPGHENMTPRQIVAYDTNGKYVNNGSSDWTVRVIPNNKPMLAIEGSISRRGEGIYDKMNGIGAHEILIETPVHNKKIYEFSVNEFAGCLRVAQERINDLKKDLRFEYTLLFKNYGAVAGATISHSHLQLVSMPIIPKRIKEELKGAQDYFSFKERCIFCDIIAQETAFGTRLITENDSFIAFAPFASKYPFEVCIMPKEHASDFRDAHNPKQIDELSSVMISVFKRLNIVLEDPAYNFVVHSSPLKESNIPYFHWHIEIVPKITKPSGFEWGTGLYVNPVTPEEAAKFLREAE